MGEDPELPDYGGACIANVVPALLDPSSVTDDGAPPDWLPEPAREAEQVILLVLDGLGWEQFQTRRSLAPTLSSLAGGCISTVVPSTTASALTSIATGKSPGEHGVVGYRIHVAGEVLNVLRWATATGDARRTIDPRAVQPSDTFCRQCPPAITKAEFADTGFTLAHLTGTRFVGYRQVSTLLTHARTLLGKGEPFVYAYYDGIDKVAHEYGMGDYYDAELIAADRLVAEMIDVLPEGATLVVTADHGQVHVGDNIVQLHPEVLSQVALQSGEGRLRWLHARPGRAAELLDAVTAHHGDQAWIRTREEVVDEAWFGPRVQPMFAARFGDVLLAAREDCSFHDPLDSGPFELIGRHGSVTPAEMRVPLLAARR